MKNNAVYYKSLVVFGAAIFLIMLILSPKGYSESASTLKTNEDKVRQEMVVISRQLGVTCTECHNIQNFASDEKKTFKVAKDHMRITETLRGSGFDGKKGPEASCFMCHQGKLRPEYKESIKK
ncbi:photosynthetic reaction center cytochrome c subunit family protein [Bdellovibrio sp. HCB337]|uniref:photosynthetic reaction center cytochrome c subunit family protein n=1 Tax=Bdellovibrio sp. HCB337 TaxID=3394358 RepID=UPI0039A4C37B